MAKASATVIIAFGANLAVAVAKTIAGVLTGSASIVAEAAHSWADTGNEIFLLVADRRGAGQRDAEHPLGYGRESYFWSTIAAFGLFTAGAVVAVYHGVQELLNPEPATDFWVAYLVLALSAVLEGISFRQAFRQARASARETGVGTIEHVLGSSNSTLRVVFAEDSAALIGLAIAFIGVLLHQLTGDSLYDALGSILVGLLLGVVAIVLIDRNRRFLVGQEVSGDIDVVVLKILLARSDISRVTYLHLEYVGPGRVYLVAAIDLTGNEDEEHVAVRLRRIERDLETNDRVEEAVLTLSTPDEASLTA
ncbi:cation diffusion facilitator family transporter [Glaciihabitans sp. dw_435]|uniref:cation diffusion facilitator family transporter n=1 Tax=Glaciihabitans sp. dw_435 TaxID=2720081 RepID=UPI001BD58604|nr:cation diffusion facilitator family transporter [Glaciihabitans sp. dw_435]